MPFEAAMRRLQEIVGKLSSGSQSLTDSLQLFEEGVRLVRTADAALAAIEVQAKELMRGDRAVAAGATSAGEPA